VITSLIADIDGTLADHGAETCPSELAEVLRTFSARDGEIVFNTGSGLKRTLQFARSAGLTVFGAIVDAGSQSFHVCDDKIINVHHKCSWSSYWERPVLASPASA
jgi:hydroxymethylpyrimidine pyrophosphatase-like HAD family hydrolase